ncbi:MAG: hemolysin family protein, partial [Candidatus Poribacteria bacterium]
SSSETALTSLTKVQIQMMREDNRKSSLAIVNFLDNPRRLFITVLLGNTFVNIAFVSITSVMLSDLLGKAAASIATILIDTIVLLIIGEITPKTYAIRHAERFSLIVARPLWFFSMLIAPMRIILRKITDCLIPLFVGDDITETELITPDEFKAMVSAGEAEGAIKEEEREIIHNIFELHDIEAREAMVPRTEMVCQEVSATVQEAINKAKEVGHSRLPVYRGDVDNICGVFHIKDWPLWRKAGIEQLTIEDFLSRRTMLYDHPAVHKAVRNDCPKVTVERSENGEKSRFIGAENTLVRTPIYVLETKKIGPLMLELTKRKSKMAILLDEYGGVSGLITVEDIVEELVGDIVDEYDTVNDHKIVRDSNNPTTIKVSGLASIRSINKHLQLNLDESFADTIGGYVVNLFELIPTTGDVIADAQSGLEFEIAAMDGTRVDQIIIRCPEKADEVRES